MLSALFCVIRASHEVMNWRVLVAQGSYAIFERVLELVIVVVHEIAAYYFL